MIELLCTDYNKKATSIHYYFGNAVLAGCCEGAVSVITVEDGTVCGLGSAVAEALMEHNVHPKHFKRLGMTTFGTAGSLPELLGFFGLDSKGIVESVQSLQ